jgi:hypothetical protein
MSIHSLKLATPVAIPEPLIVATAVFEDSQLTKLVGSCLLPSQTFLPPRIAGSAPR